MNCSTAVLICKALSDSHRVQIVEMLKEREICACKILEKFHITQPTLSHHMKVLCECNLINVRKSGKWVHYSIKKETFREFKEFIENLYINVDESDISDCCS